jgi:hypothetical protein
MSNYYLLLLNDMRGSKSEILEPVARATDPQKLIDFMQRERVEPYRDNGLNVLPHTTDQLAGTTEIRPNYTYGKSFRQGGPLEWYNSPFNEEHARQEHIVQTGTREDWAQQASEDWDRRIGAFPEVF